MDTECVSITLTLDPVKTIYNKLNCICETLKQIFSKLLLYKQSDPGSVTKQEFRSAQQGVCQISFIKLGKGSTSKENETKILTRCLCRLSLKVFVLSLCYRPLILYIHLADRNAWQKNINFKNSRSDIEDWNEGNNFINENDCTSGNSTFALSFQTC